MAILYKDRQIAYCVTGLPESNYISNTPQNTLVLVYAFDTKQVMIQ